MLKDLAPIVLFRFGEQQWILNEVSGNLRQYRTIRWQRRRCLFRHLLLADFSIYLQ